MKNSIENIKDFREISKIWFEKSVDNKYSYNFTWLGRPIIQYPQDILIMQELVWNIKPEIIVETGVAHGGSVIFYASMLELIGGTGKVIGIDVDIRQQNRVEIEKHPMFKRIVLLEGSSTSEEIVKQVMNITIGKKVLLVLDSLHNHKHVFDELILYSPLIRSGSYIVVFDTVIEDLPRGYFKDRPWDKGDNPKTAVREFLKNNDRFIIDNEIEKKTIITVAPDGFLKCIKD